jgi:hypothetical protein
MNSVLIILYLLNGSPVKTRVYQMEDATACAAAVKSLYESSGEFYKGAPEGSTVAASCNTMRFLGGRDA